MIFRGFRSAEVQKSTKEFSHGIVLNELGKWWFVDFCFAQKLCTVCWHFCAKNDNKLCTIFGQTKSKQTLCHVGVSIKVINQNFQTDFAH